MSLRASWALSALVLLSLATAAGAQNAAVTVSVDAGADRHPISPLVYGVAHADATTAADLRVPLNRNGGNNTSRYNWLVNADNRGADWYFESVPYASATAGEVGDTFIALSRGAGAEPMLTIPTVGWVAKLGSGRAKLASFSIAKYGAQTDRDWQWFPDAGNGVATSGADITGNDPADASVPADSVFQQGWMQHLVSTWGLAGQGGLRYYILDNEPSIWFSTHRDVHPVGPTMDEVRDKMVDYGGRVKDVDPGALVVGPEEWGWSGYFYSGYDQQRYNVDGTLPDRAAHAGADYLPWLLDQMRQAESASGRRLLDVFTVHYYPQGGEFGNDVSTTMQLRRNRSTRSLWDPAYVDETWIADTVRLVPRLHEWVNASYPGTAIGVTEYNWGAEGHINGATAQADVLGIFGREGLDLAARWTTPDPSTPTYKAMKMYRNYDGAGSGFGDVSVRTVVPNPDTLSAFGGVRTNDGALTVMVVSKVLSGTTPVTVSLAGFAAAGTAQAWQLTSGNAIQRLADLAASGSVSLTVPPQSITLLVVPPGTSGGLPQLSIGNASVAEGDAGTTTAAFTVRLSAPSTAEVTVSWATADGTAGAGSDYAAGAGTLTIPAGTTTGTIAVTVNGDTLLEPDETFFVNLSGAKGALVATSQGRGTIINDDLPALAIADARVTEPRKGSVSAAFTVTLSAAAAAPVTVAYATADVTAQAGRDYGATSGTLTFPAGSTTQSIRVPVYADAVNEPLETFTVTLASPSGARLADAQAVGTIVNRKR